MSIGLLLLLAVIATDIWVGVDASRREWPGFRGTAWWVVGCVLLWIVIFPLYLWKRTTVPLKQSSAAATSATPATGQNAYGLPRERLYRECPHCKEAMRRDADYCPHCRQPSTPWRYHDGYWWYREGESEPWEWLDERSGAWTALAAPTPPAG